MRKWQKRNLAVTALTAVFLLIVYLGLLFQDSRKTEGDELKIYVLEESVIDHLNIISQNGEVSLMKKDNSWYYEKDETFPLNQKFAETMLKKTSVLKAKRLVAEGKKNFSAYGLDQPTVKIQVSAGKEGYAIDIGSCNGATGDYYMTVEGTEKIYTVDETFYNLFSNDILSMAERESLPGVTLDRILELSVTQEGRKLALIKNNSSDKGGWIIQEGEEIQEADSSMVNQLLAQIMKIRYDRMEVYHPVQEQLHSYGLEQPAAELCITYLENETDTASYVIDIGKEDGEDRFVYAKNGRGIYRTKDRVVQPFMNLKSESFLTMNVAPIRQQELDGLTILADARRAEFTMTSSADGKILYSLNGQEITEKEFNRFYYLLYSFSAEKRVADITEQLRQEPVMTLIYDRKEEEGTDCKVELIPYDQNYYGAKVNGKAVLLVNRQKVNQLLQEAERIFP